MLDTSWFEFVVSSPKLDNPVVGSVLAAESGTIDPEGSNVVSSSATGVESVIGILVAGGSGDAPLAESGVIVASGSELVVVGLIVSASELVLVAIGSELV